MKKPNTSKLPKHLQYAREAGRVRARMQSRAGMPGHRDLTEQYRLLKRGALKTKPKKNPSSRGKWQKIRDGEWGAYYASGPSFEIIHEGTYYTLYRGRWSAKARSFKSSVSLGRYKSMSEAQQAAETSRRTRSNPRKRNPAGRGPWKTMAEIRAAHDGYFFKNKPRRGSEYERPEKIKGPYNGRFVVVQKETKLSDGWKKSGVIYRVTDDAQFRHVETLWGSYSWENAVDMAKGMEG